MKLSKTENRNLELQQKQLETFWLEITKPQSVANITQESARKGNQLGTMKKHITEEKAVAIVSKIIERLNTAVKVGNKMDNYDVMECAVTLVNEYWYVKFEQLLHFSKLVRQGRLGTFPRFGQPEFFDLLGKYLLKQDDTRADEYQSNKHQGSSDRQTDNSPAKLGTILTKEDLNEIDRAKEDFNKS